PADAITMIAVRIGDGLGNPQAIVASPDHAVIGAVNRRRVNRYSSKLRELLKRPRTLPDCRTMKSPGQTATGAKSYLLLTGSVTIQAECSAGVNAPVEAFFGLPVQSPLRRPDSGAGRSCCNNLGYRRLRTHC